MLNTVQNLMQILCKCAVWDRSLKTKETVATLKASRQKLLVAIEWATLFPLIQSIILFLRILHKDGKLQYGPSYSMSSQGKRERQGRKEENEGWWCSHTMS